MEIVTSHSVLHCATLAAQPAWQELARSWLIAYPRLGLEPPPQAEAAFVGAVAALPHVSVTLMSSNTTNPPMTLTKPSLIHAFLGSPLRLPLTYSQGNRIIES